MIRRNDTKRAVVGNTCSFLLLPLLHMLMHPSQPCLEEDGLAAAYPLTQPPPLLLLPSAPTPIPVSAQL